MDRDDRNNSRTNPDLEPRLHAIAIFSGRCVDFGDFHGSLVDRIRRAIVCVRTGRQTAGIAGRRSRLPKPDPAFKGKIGETYKDSTPSYPQPVKAPKGSPERAARSCSTTSASACARTFGGPVPTPQHGQAREQRAEVHPLPHDRPLLARRGRPCSPAAIITASAPASSSRWAPAIPATPASSRGAPPWSPRRFATTATPRRCSARRTTRPSRRSARPDRSTAGRPARGSTTSTASTRAKRSQYYPVLYRNTTAVQRAEDAGTGLPLHRGHDRRGHRLDQQHPRRRIPTSPGSATSAPARSTPRTTPRRNGGTSTRASSTTAGTSSAR